MCAYSCLGDACLYVGSQRVSVYIAIFVGVVVCPKIGYEAHP